MSRCGRGRVGLSQLCTAGGVGTQALLPHICPISVPTVPAVSKASASLTGQGRANVYSPLLSSPVSFPQPAPCCAPHPGIHFPTLSQPDHRWDASPLPFYTVFVHMTSTWKTRAELGKKLLKML